ncbi:MAG: PEP-CTERM sorting domain-containing protein [Verrucomicrobiales bacterium]|jgi:hypothetical protein|nr:PEP-CTERM sorting domain-containing protein [Verrucomicrobiales bacterium]
MKTINKYLMCAVAGACLLTPVFAETIWIDDDFSTGDGDNIAGWKAIKSDQVDAYAWVIGDGKLNLLTNNKSWNGSGRTNNLGTYSDVAGTSFTMSTDMIINDETTAPGAGSWISANTRLGFSFLGSNNSNPWASTLNNTSYYAILRGNGNLVIGQVNAAAYTELATSTTGFGNLVMGTVSYTMTLDGIYNDLGGLDLTFSVENNAGDSHSVSYSVDTTPYAGQYFGYFTWQGDNHDGGNTRLNLDFDYFRLAEYTVIPEPSTIALLGVGAGLLFFLRRRK